MKRLLSLMLVLATATSAASCSSDVTGPGAQSGSYTLTRLGGFPPPAPLFYNNSADHTEILGAQITLSNNGTYTDVTQVQDTYNGSTSVFDQRTSGTWTISGSQLTLQDNTSYANITYATVSGNQVIIEDFSGSGKQAIYSR